MYTRCTLIRIAWKYEWTCEQRCGGETAVMWDKLDLGSVSIIIQNTHYLKNISILPTPIKEWVVEMKGQSYTYRVRLCEQSTKIKVYLKLAQPFSHTLLFFKYL